MHNTHVKFLLDSGAAISVVNYNVVKEVPINPVQTRAISANGSPLDVIGEIVTDIVLGDVTVQQNFIVVRELSVDCLLGADFLQNHGAVLDCNNHTLSFGVCPRSTVPVSFCQRSPSSNPVNCILRAPTDMEIPGRTIQLLNGQVDTIHSDGSVILIEPMSSLPDYLHVACSLGLVEKGHVVIQVMNVSPSPVTIFKGMRLAMTTPEHSILLVSQQQPPTEDLPFLADNAVAPQFDTVATPDLSSVEREQLLELLTSFRDIFAPPSGPHGCTSVVKHGIPTNGPPIRQPMRRMPEALKDTITSEVDRMLEQNIIQPSSSPWSSPVVMVQKKDGSWRFCIDYRKLNSVTHRDAYPLPRIDATLDSLTGCRYFTTLDLAAGYWQVKLEEDDKEKTAFSTPQGHFEFNVMPFGLTNAPATFQRLMECTLAGLTHQQCLIYLDDIIVFSSSFPTHLERLRNVFTALRQANLQLKLSKCAFVQKEVRYLGHIVSVDGVKPDPKKIEVVSSYPTPRSAKELKQFLGLTNYYRKFILNYAHIAEPLYKMLRGPKKMFNWTTLCQQVFDNLKSKLTHPPVLGYPDFSLPFVLHTDASEAAVGAVLSQCIDGHERVVSYWSRQLSKPERNYSTVEREALAVVYAIKEFYPYLYGFSFRLVTDHNPLTSLRAIKDVGGRLARWILYLQQFTFTWEHRAGKHHNNADAMSRLPPTDPVLGVFHQWSPNTDTIKAAQCTDNILSPVVSALATNGSLPTNTAPGLRHCIMEDGVLCRRFRPSSSSTQGHLQVIIPESLKRVVFQQLHDQAGHLGMHKTLEKVKERFYWPDYERDIATWIQECQECQKRNQPQPAQQAPLETLTSNYPFKMLSWDIMGPLPVTSNGNKYILVVTDIFSKWVEAFAIQSTDTETLATLLVNEIICRYGTPSYLHSDQGTNFTSKLMAAVCKRLGIEQTRTSSYHPQGNGQVERFNRTLEAMLAKVVSDHQRDWDNHLPRLLFAYRTAIHETTGFSPFHITFGRSPSLPIDVFLGSPKQTDKSVPSFLAEVHQSLHKAYVTVRQNISSAHRRNKTRYDQQKPFSPFQVGDQVWLFTPVVKVGTTKKFTSQWRGPYTVLDRINKVNYRITLIGSSAKPLVVHHNRLKLCHGTPQQFITAASQPSPNIENRPLYSEVLQRTVPTVGGYTTSPNSSPTATTRITTTAEPNITTTATPTLATTATSNSTDAVVPSTSSAIPTSTTSNLSSTSSNLSSTSAVRPQRQHRPPARYNDFIAP